MAETEVESILREIRERVVSQERAGRGAATASRSTSGTGGNGASDSVSAQHLTRSGDPAPVAAEDLTLINSYLTTTARAWDRLPPLVSNRNGLAARLELWLKRRLRAATHWFTWEQVNFNAAVHHALRDLLPLLAAYQQQLRTLQAKIDAEADQRGLELEQQRAEMSDQHVAIRAEFSTIRAEIEAQRTAHEAQRAELRSRLADLVRELRERDERLQGEQRVSFKQLSLEASEAAVLEDRARRQNETLLQELSRRVEQLESDA